MTGYLLGVDIGLLAFRAWLGVVLAGVALILFLWSLYERKT